MDWSSTRHQAANKRPSSIHLDIKTSLPHRIASICIFTTPLSRPRMQRSQSCFPLLSFLWIMIYVRTIFIGVLENHPLLDTFHSFSHCKYLIPFLVLICAPYFPSFLVTPSAISTHRYRWWFGLLDSLRGLDDLLGCCVVLQCSYWYYNCSAQCIGVWRGYGR